MMPAATSVRAQGVAEGRQGAAVRDGGAAVRDGGTAITVVDEHVQRLPAVEETPRKGAHGCQVGKIELGCRHRRPWHGLTQARAGAFRLDHIAAGKNDAVASGEEGARGLEPNTRVSARHHTSPPCDAIGPCHAVTPCPLHRDER